MINQAPTLVNKINDDDEPGANPGQTVVRIQHNVIAEIVEILIPRPTPVPAPCIPASGWRKIPASASTSWADLATESLQAAPDLKGCLLDAWLETTSHRGPATNHHLLLGATLLRGDHNRSRRPRAWSGLGRQCT